MNICFLVLLLATIISILNAESNKASTTTHFINKDSKLKGFAQSQWFKDNIPFVEIPDKEIEDVYYYRWTSHKRHLRYTTPGTGYQVTEFINNVGYAGKFEVINAAAGHHIYESRWLRNERYAKDYINFWARQYDSVGIKYSEWITDAAWATYLVNRDKKFIVSQLDGFVNAYQLWEKTNFEPKLGLFYITPEYDAQELSAASVQTKDKFHGGLGYRPSFNSELYGNAIAITKIAKLAENTTIADIFAHKAEALREAIIKYLWDPKRNFFYHVQRENNPNNERLDTMEEVGFYPWRFQVPKLDSQQFNFSSAWQQLFDLHAFNSQFGPTTCDMKSKWYDGNQKHQCCWWNGNSWPYSTAHTLSSLAKEIKSYSVQNKKPDGFKADDYVLMLRKYALTQYKNGVPYVAECHSPQGDWWVGDSGNHSEHYAHSTYTNNVLNELIGITPLENNSLLIDPLIPAKWNYFIAENVAYGGHNLTVLYDKNGEKYNVGSGMKVYIDGKLVSQRNDIGMLLVNNIDRIDNWKEERVENYAANVKVKGYPMASASYNCDFCGSPWQAVDGRIFYDFVPSNRWANFGSPNDSDWFAIDFGPGRARVIDSVSVYVYEDVISHIGRTDCPTRMVVEYFDDKTKSWIDAKNQISTPKICSPNDLNVISFDAVKTQKVRIVFFRNKAKNYFVAIPEIEVWSKWPQTTPNTYEAEDAVVTDANIHASSDASGGSYVGQIDYKTSSVEFSGVRSPRKGDVKVLVYFANGSNRTAVQLIEINNLHKYQIMYPPTKHGWGHFDERKYVNLTLPFELGDNVILIKHENDNAVELDKIELIF